MFTRRLLQASDVYCAPANALKRAFASTVSSCLILSSNALSTEPSWRDAGMKRSN
jgi:hypothetical protein